MSETPRTDEKVKIVRLTVGCVELPENHMVSADFARQLEIECAEARAEIKRLKQELRGNSTIVSPAVLALNDATAELVRKDKLIEQMYEAIKFSLIADEVRQSRNVCASDINNACEDSRIKRFAALSAAERGE